MTPEEKSKMIMELMAARERDTERIQRDKDDFDGTFLPYHECRQYGLSRMYLDDHVVDIEHLCCMAHARFKFKYVLEQGGDKDAAFILGLIGELYKLEREYEEDSLSPEQIRLYRNN